MEKKAINFELKDLDTSKRTAIIAHAAYNNIDRTNDISRKGMFNKSWSENKDNINFYLNHKDEQAPGKVVDVYEDDDHAYTKAWLGTHTLGNDVLLMMDEGIIKKASFGYYATKTGIIEVKSKRVRELKEVVHFETSVLTVQPANLSAGVRSVVKSLDEKELKSLTKELSEHLIIMEGFCHNTAASDDCIKSILFQIDQTKQLISDYNTVYTQADISLEPYASIEEKGFLDVLTIFKKTLINN